MKMLSAAIAFVLTAAPAFADEPDGLKLPPGFHASVVAEGLGAVRHLAVRSNGDLFVSTPRNRQGIGGGIIALHLDPDHKAGQPQHFGVVDGGTGIRFYRGALYAATPSRVYRYSFTGKGLLPNSEPQIVLDGMPAGRGSNRGLAFDGKGNMFVSLDGVGNVCADPDAPKGAPPAGVKPCPDLAGRAGVWRFSASKLGQKFPADGEHVATGIRDTTSLDWSPQDGALYSVMHGRDDAHKDWPDMISASDDEHIADEMHKITKGTDFGWPYTYYDAVRKVRLTAPEYGGDGKTLATGSYSTPVVAFHSGRAAPLDLQFYTGDKFPAEYRGGAFVVLHGGGGAQSPAGHNGYDVVFVPFDRSGKAGDPKVFAEGFAGPDPSNKNSGGHAKYRPTAAAVGPDGALYVADSVKGRIWRIYYGDQN
jgi:glucose/arabinose dehydrogenase